MYNKKVVTWVREEREEIEKQFRTMKLSEEKKEVKLTFATYCIMSQQRHLLNRKCWRERLDFKWTASTGVRTLSWIRAHLWEIRLKRGVPVLFMCPNGIHFTKTDHHTSWPLLLLILTINRKSSKHRSTHHSTRSLSASRLASTLSSPPGVITHLTGELWPVWLGMVGSTSQIHHHIQSWLCCHWE